MHCAYGAVLTVALVVSHTGLVSLPVPVVANPQVTPAGERQEGTLSLLLLLPHLIVAAMPSALSLVVSPMT